MRATHKRLIIWGILGASLAIVLMLLFKPSSVPVDLAAVTTGSMVVTIDEEGETRVRDTFVLSAPVAGQISRITAEVGDTTIAGETVFCTIQPIDPALLDVRSRAQAEAVMHAAEAAEALAIANLEQARAEMDFSAAELARARQLREAKMISISELESSNRNHKITRASFGTATAALRVSQYDLESAKAQLLSPVDAQPFGDNSASVLVRAPVNGHVLRVLQESEGIVAAGTPLVEIGDTTDLEIIVDLLSTDAVRVQAGQRVIIDNWGGVGELEGSVRRVEPYAITKVSALGIEEQRVNVIINLLSPVSQRIGLGHGYQLAVRIVLFEGADILTVPLTSLVRDGGHWALYVEQDGRAVQRRVLIGRQTGLIAEILDGITIGERIVLYPSGSVADQTKIVERQES